MTLAPVYKPQIDNITTTTINCTCSPRSDCSMFWMSTNLLDARFSYFLRNASPRLGGISLLLLGSLPNASAEEIYLSLECWALVLRLVDDRNMMCSIFQLYHPPQLGMLIFMFHILHFCVLWPSLRALIVACSRYICTYDKRTQHAARRMRMTVCMFRLARSPPSLMDRPNCRKTSLMQLWRMEKCQRSWSWWGMEGAWSEFSLVGSIFGWFRFLDLLRTRENAKDTPLQNSILHPRYSGKFIRLLSSCNRAIYG